MSVEVNSSPINTTPFKKKSKPDPVEFMPNIWMQSYIKLREFLYFLSGFGSYLVLALNVLLLYVKFKQQSAVVMVFIQDNTMIYIEYALIGISIANCIQFFMFSTKQIVLFNHPTKPKFPTSEYDNQWDLERKSKNCKLVMMELEHLVDGEWKTIKELKWVLDVWEPSTFCTTMLTYFSPLQVFMIYLSSSRNKELILLSYCSMAFIWLLVDYYGKKLTDSEIMSGELMNTKVDKQLQYSVVCTPRK